MIRAPLAAPAWLISRNPRAVASATVRPCKRRQPGVLTMHHHRAAPRILGVPIRDPCARDLVVILGYAVKKVTYAYPELPRSPEFPR
jgi:hypothetical protein